MAQQHGRGSEQDLFHGETGIGHGVRLVKEPGLQTERAPLLLYITAWFPWKLFGWRALLDPA